MKTYFSFTEVSVAKQIMNDAYTLDRFGSFLYPVEFVVWAEKVLKWFKNYLSKVRELATKLRTTWNKAVSYVWGQIKSLALKISDR